MTSPSPNRHSRRESSHPPSLANGPAPDGEPLRRRPLPDASAGARALLEVHTLDEAAALLRVRRSWLERQAAARKIPFTLLGGAYHFTSAHLVAIVQRHEVVPESCGEREQSVPDPPSRLRPRPGRPAAGADLLQPRPRTGPRRAA